MPLHVLIHDGNIYFASALGTILNWAPKRNLVATPAAAAAQNAAHFGVRFFRAPDAAGAYTINLTGPNSKYHQHSTAAPSPRAPMNVQTTVTLSDDQFLEFKRGGKRRPTKPATFKQIQTGVSASVILRPDRRGDLVQEGDVGPYKTGPESLKPKLKAAASAPTAAFSAHVDVARGIQHPNPPDKMKMNRDHMNNQRVLNARGADPNAGLTMAIPQWVHKNGYTWGYKALKDKHGGAVSRTTWATFNGGAALFKEFFHELRTYHEGGRLTCEVVGSYRYLYKLHMKSNPGLMGNVHVDRLLMFYLHAAANALAPDAVVPWI